MDDDTGRKHRSFKDDYLSTIVNIPVSENEAVAAIARF